MPDEETTQQAEQRAENPNEEVWELQGAGFIPNRPGIYANCRVIFFVENGEVTSRIEPLGGVAPTPAESVSEPVVTALPDAQSTIQEQSTNQENTGG